MKRNIILSAIASLLLLAACDKIEPNEEGRYDIFSGAAGTWYDGTAVADHTQRAFLEKYTGVRCVNCPTADDAISQAMGVYGEQLVVVAIHDSSTFCKPYTGNIDMRTDDGDAWSTFFGVKATGSYPNAMVNRTSTGNAFDLFTPTSGIEGRVDNALAESPRIAIDVKSQLSGREAAIDVSLEFLQKVSQQLTLTLLVIEDGLVAAQMLPDGSKEENYTHNHILRDVITDPLGAAVDADGHQGTKRHAVFTYTLSEEWNADKCHVIAFVSDAATHAVINVDECALNE